MCYAALLLLNFCCCLSRSIGIAPTKLRSRIIVFFPCTEIKKPLGQSGFQNLLVGTVEEERSQNFIRGKDFD
jgi:hypothetical protein